MMETADFVPPELIVKQEKVDCGYGDAGSSVKSPHNGGVTVTAVVPSEPDATVVPSEAGDNNNHNDPCNIHAAEAVVKKEEFNAESEGAFDVSELQKTKARYIEVPASLAKANDVYKFLNSKEIINTENEECCQTDEPSAAVPSNEDVRPHSPQSVSIDVRPSSAEVATDVVVKQEVEDVVIKQELIDAPIQRRISQSIVGDDYGSEEGEASDSEEEDDLAQVMVKEECEEGELSEEECAVVKMEQGEEGIEKEETQVNGVIDLDNVKTENDDVDLDLDESEEEVGDIDYECSDEDVPDSRLRSSYMLGQFLKELVSGDFKRRRSKANEKEEAHSKKMEEIQKKRDAKIRKNMTKQERDAMDDASRKKISILDFLEPKDKGMRLLPLPADRTAPEIKIPSDGLSKGRPRREFLNRDRDGDKSDVEFIGRDEGRRQRARGRDSFSRGRRVYDVDNDTSDSEVRGPRRFGDGNSRDRHSDRHKSVSSHKSERDNNRSDRDNNRSDRDRDRRRRRSRSGSKDSRRQRKKRSKDRDHKRKKDRRRSRSKSEEKTRREKNKKRRRKESNSSSGSEDDKSKSSHKVVNSSDSDNDVLEVRGPMTNGYSQEEEPHSRSNDDTASQASSFRPPEPDQMIIDEGTPPPPPVNMFPGAANPEPPNRQFGLSPPKPLNNRQFGSYPPEPPTRQFGDSPPSPSSRQFNDYLPEPTSRQFSPPEPPNMQFGNNSEPSHMQFGDPEPPSYRQFGAPPLPPNNPPMLQSQGYQNYPRSQPPGPPTNFFPNQQQQQSNNPHGPSPDYQGNQAYSGGPQSTNYPNQQYPSHPMAVQPPQQPTLQPNYYQQQQQQHSNHSAMPARQPQPPYPTNIPSGQTFPQANTSGSFPSSYNQNIVQVKQEPVPQPPATSQGAMHFPHTSLSKPNTTSGPGVTVTVKQELGLTMRASSSSSSSRLPLVKKEMSPPRAGRGNSYRISPPKQTIRGVATSDKLTSNLMLDEVKKAFKKLVEDAVRNSLKRAWGLKKITKDEYKEIFRKSVDKVTNSKETTVKNDKIQQMVDIYVSNTIAMRRQTKK